MQQGKKVQEGALDSGSRRNYSEEAATVLHPLSSSLVFADFAVLNDENPLALTSNHLTSLVWRQVSTSLLAQSYQE